MNLGKMVVAGVLVFFLFLGLCQGEKCNCISYLISEDGLASENQISSITYEVEDTKCDGDGLFKCKDFCIQMYQEMTDNGKVCSKLAGDDKRVADWMCESLKRDITNARIGVFAKNCDSDLLDTGFRFIETLTCKAGYALYC